MRLCSGQTLWGVPKDVRQTREPVEYRVLADQNIGTVRDNLKEYEILVVRPEEGEPEAIPAEELFFSKELARDAAGYSLAMRNTRNADIRQELERQSGAV